MGEKVPYMLALFVGALGWAVSHTSERLISSPTVEYSIAYDPVDPVKPDERKRVTVRIRNLSDKETFRNVTFVLRRQSESAMLKFIGGSSAIVPRAPAWIGESEAVEQEDAVQFSLALVPPGSTIELHADVSGIDEAVFQGKVKDGSFRLVKCSLATFVVRNEFWIIFVGLVVWLLALVGLARMRK
ncbi:MAG: hypothetical protein AB7O31_05515 [Burkholderiales bacterium]